MSEVLKSVEFLEKKAKEYWCEALRAETAMCAAKDTAECLERAAQFLRSEGEKKREDVNPINPAAATGKAAQSVAVALSVFKTRPSPQKPASKYQGVSKARGKWRATVYIDKKNKYLGTFDDELEAAIAVADEEGRDVEADCLRVLAGGKAKAPAHDDFVEDLTKSIKEAGKIQRGEAKASRRTVIESPVPTIWECNKCCEPHETTGERPDKCRDCGKDQGFTRVRDLTRSR